VLLAISALAVVSQIYLPLPLFGTIAENYGVSAVTAGLVSTVFGLAYACGQLFFGTLSDRTGRKVVMVSGLAALALASLLVGLLPSFGGVLAARTLQGFVAGALPPVAIAYLPEQLPGGLKVFGIGCMTTAFLLAGLLGQLYGGAIGTLSGAVLPLAAVYAVAAALVAFLPEERGRRDEEGGGEAEGLFSVFRGMGSLLAQGALLRAYVATLTVLFCFVGFYVSLELFARGAIEGSGLSLTAVRAVAVPAMLLTLVAPRFIVRRGPRSVVRAGLAIASLGLFAAAATTAIAGLGGAGAVWALVAASVVFVAGVSLTTPSLIALVGSLAPDRRGTATSLYAFILFVGASLGPQLPPLIPRLLGAEGPAVPVICAALACVLAAAAVLNAGVRKQEVPEEVP
jgi:MFS family permease